MKSEVQIETENTEKIKKVIGLSLESGDKVDYDLEAETDSLKIRTDADGLGVLRGCTDTVFRLTTLAKKLYSRC